MDGMKSLFVLENLVQNYSISTTIKFRFVVENFDGDVIHSFADQTIEDALKKMVHYISCAKQLDEVFVKGDLVFQIGAELKIIDPDLKPTHLSRFAVIDEIYLHRNKDLLDYVNSYVEAVTGFSCLENMIDAVMRDNKE